MSENVDWTKPVEYFGGAHHIPVEVLWHDERWPDMTLIAWGAKVSPCLAKDFLSNLRNVPPPPPEVWLVWEKHTVGRWEIVARFLTRRDADREADRRALPSHVQKVVCDAPR